MDATTTLTYTPTREHRRVVSLNSSPHPSQNEHRRNQSEPPTMASPMADTPEMTSELDDEHEYFGGAYDALAPAGISFRGPDGSVHTGNAEPGLFATARRYLLDKFGVTIVHALGHWLVFGCEPSVPSGRMPGIAGGFLAVWRPASDMYFNPFVGEAGERYINAEEEEEMETDETIIARFKQYAIPTTEAIIGLAGLFPECDAMTFVVDTIVVEYPATDELSFRKRLQTLPDYLPGAPFDIRYHNGPLPNTPQRRRLRRPRPELEEESRVADEIDYVARDGKFYPGSMISSTALDGTIYSSVSAGVLLFNGNDTRLTCPWHNWEDHFTKYPTLLGEDDDEARRVFTIVQGEPGTKVGHVVRRIGNTDIALASLGEGVAFENTFMDIQACAKRLVHSDSINLNDVYLIDGFTTGRQRLPGCGARFELDRDPVHPALISPNGDGSLLPPPGIYVSVVQGVCATMDDVQTKPPYIRGRACGAVLVRVRDGRNLGCKQKEMLARGEVCGIFHYADLTPRNRESATQYLAYTEVFDPLIEEGWRVVPAPGQEVQENVMQRSTDVESAATNFAGNDRKAHPPTV
ncbi:hypothetical protein B0T16DRAFT_409126 [Cercophora newfieldiana]|uniref:Uncharacterized protein n=1 Tax=Cercophora newfieldiana TaxID=92897 RepID=A0AA40CRP8_9PEZI|nr:hypothetical protein B0T16DRAFT_409126 [Cercophora newfieldiana]